MARSSSGLKLASGALLVFATVALWKMRGSAPRVIEPKDQELISTFQAHRQAFEQLQEMVTADARRGLYLAGSDPGKLGQPRRDTYTNLIAQIRPGMQVVMTGPTGGVIFIFAGEGTAIGPDWVKGIEYVPGVLGVEGVVLPDQNNAAILPANVYIRVIEPKWLIFYQRDE